MEAGPTRSGWGPWAEAGPMLQVVLRGSQHVPFAHLCHRDAPLHPARLAESACHSAFNKTLETPTVRPASGSQEKSLDEGFKEVLWLPQHLTAADLCHGYSHLVTISLFIYPRHRAHLGGGTEHGLIKVCRCKASRGLQRSFSCTGWSVSPDAKVFEDQVCCFCPVSGEALHS